MDYDKLRDKTVHGYEPYELMSAMQKFIRRSMEREALFCFYEMEAHGLYPHIRNRLLIIVYEDVGIANMELLGSIGSHIEKMNEFYKKKNGAWRLVLGNIILMACRGEKSRIADQFVCSVAADMCNGFRLDFNEYDFIFDMHTKKGRAMGRGADHFYNEASKIIKSESTTDYWKEEIDASNFAESNGCDVLEDYKKPDKQLQEMIDRGGNIDLFDG